MSVTVVMPALNEVESIGRVLAEIPRQAVQEVIVVDGGSMDETAAIAQAAGARVIRQPCRGYGQACATGLSAAAGDIIVFMDADGADDPAHIPDLLTPILDHTADMVLGSRLRGASTIGTMPWQQRVGNQLAAWLINHLYGLKLSDLGTFRAVRREPLLTLGMQEMTYGWPTEMIVKAARRGWRITEIPVCHRARFGGRSKISGTLRGTALAAYFILGTIFRYAIHTSE